MLHDSCFMVGAFWCCSDKRAPTLQCRWSSTQSPPPLGACPPWSPACTASSWSISSTQNRSAPDMIMIRGAQKQGCHFVATAMCQLWASFCNAFAENVQEEPLYS